MLGTVRIQGADATANNTTSGAWKPTKQVTAVASFLNKLVVYVPDVVGGTRYVWIFDAAAGSGASADPVAVLACPNGFTTTLDFGDYGKLFVNGIFLSVSSTDPTSPTATVTAAVDNEAKISVDYKVK